MSPVSQTNVISVAVSFPYVLNKKSMNMSNRNNLLREFIAIFLTYRSSRLEIFYKIGVLRSFVNFTGKNLCWSLFLITLQALDLKLY